MKNILHKHYLVKCETYLIRKSKVHAWLGQRNRFSIQKTADSLERKVDDLSSRFSKIETQLDEVVMLLKNKNFDSIL